MEWKTFLRESYIWILIFVVLPIGLAVAVTYEWLTFSQTGIIIGSNLGLYYLNGTEVPTPYHNDWGTLVQNETRTVTFLIRNKGQTNITLLFDYTRTTPNPTDLFNYLSVTDSYDGSVLMPTQDYQITFSLETFDNTTLLTDPLTFNFAIHIIGT